MTNETNTNAESSARAKKPGRPRFVPTEKQKLEVEVLASCGMPHTHIASRIMNPETRRPIDEKTLRKAFRKELDSGMTTANALVAQSLFKAATSGASAGAVNAAKFWLACRAGWKPTEAVELTGKDGAPLPGAPTLSADQFEELARKLNTEV